MNTRVRTAKRPAGWIAPGPTPAGPGDREDLWPAEDEDLCYLAGDWRIFQKLDGHRWSLDDLLTAWFAVQHAPDPVLHALDLGCGIGSVLMMTAWALPNARCVGVEAQVVSAGLARRSVAYNGEASRVEVIDGDLRDLSALDPALSFDLVTGTPPYIPPGEGVISDKIQCGPCRFELRGGVEVYVEAAAKRLAAEGCVCVLCGRATHHAGPC
jgi:tRNA1Val (adenine37-N6)-methyltransferase